MPSCGQSGTVTVDLTLVGFEQTFNPSALNDVTANLKVLAIGKSNTVNASGSILSSEDCQVTINSPSNPAWNGTAVTGIGWKILTKSTFQHFSMAGTQSDIINPSSGIPDSHEPRGDSLIRFNDNGTLVGGTIDIGGMSSENVDKVNGAIDTIVQGLGCGFG